MKTKFPMLHAMRARRNRIEAEIAAPYRAETVRANMLAAQERDARVGLERAMASRIAPMIIDDMSRNMSRALEREIMKASVQALKSEPTTKIEVPTGMLLRTDPRSIVSRVIDWWKLESAPRIMFRAIPRGDTPISSHVTRLRVSVPELHYEHMVEDMP